MSVPETNIRTPHYPKILQFDEQQTPVLATPIPRSNVQPNLDSRPSLAAVAEQICSSVKKYLNSTTPSVRLTLRSDPPMTPMRKRVPETPVAVAESSSVMEEKFDDLRNAEEFLVMGWLDGYDETRLTQLQQSVVPVIEWLQAKKKANEKYEQTLANVDRLITQLLAKKSEPIQKEIAETSPRKVDTLFSDYFAMRDKLERKLLEDRQNAQKFERMIAQVLSSKTTTASAIPTTRTGLREEDLEQESLDESKADEFQEQLASAVDSLQKEEKLFDECTTAIEDAQQQLGELLAEGSTIN